MDVVQLHNGRYTIIKWTLYNYTMDVIQLSSPYLQNKAEDTTRLADQEAAC